MTAITKESLAETAAFVQMRVDALETELAHKCLDSTPFVLALVDTSDYNPAALRAHPEGGYDFMASGTDAVTFTRQGAELMAAQVNAHDEMGRKVEMVGKVRFYETALVANRRTLDLFRELAATL